MLRLIHTFFPWLQFLSNISSLFNSPKNFSVGGNDYLFNFSQECIHNILHLPLTTSRSGKFDIYYFLVISHAFFTLKTLENKAIFCYFYLFKIILRIWVYYAIFFTIVCFAIVCFFYNSQQFFIILHCSHRFDLSHVLQSLHSIQYYIYKI